jgi:maltose-binding protein MalE
VCVLLLLLLLLLLSRGNALFQKFIAPGSEMEINVDHDVARQIQTTLAADPGPDLFMEAQDRVYQLLATGAFLKFSLSPMFQFRTSKTSGMPSARMPCCG